MSPPAPLRDHKPLTNLPLPGTPDSRHSLMESVDGLPVGDGKGAKRSWGEGSGEGQELREWWGSEGNGLKKRGAVDPEMRRAQRREGMRGRGAGVPGEKRKGQGMEVGSWASGRYPPQLLLSVGIRFNTTPELRPQLLCGHRH